MSIRIAGAFALSLCLGGCSVLTDLSELTPDSAVDSGVDSSLDSSEEASDPDSSTDSGAPDASEDSAPPDASEDSAPPDANADSEPTDASGDSDLPDAVDSGDTGPTKTFCELLSGAWGYTYCRDFDDAEPFAFNWDARVTDPGGTLERDTDAYSLPACFLATVQPGDAGSCVKAYAEKTVAPPGAFDHSSLAFRLRMGTMDGLTPFEGSFMSLRYLGDSDAGATEPCTLILYGDGQSGMVVEDTATPTTHPFTVRFPLEYEWTKVELTVDRVAKTFDVRLDGASTFSTTQTLSAECAVGGSAVVLPGVVCSAQVPAASGEVRIDDIVYND